MVNKIIFYHSFPGASYFVIWNFIEAQVNNEDKEVEQEGKEVKVKAKTKVNPLNN